LSLATRSAAAARGVRPGLHAELVPASRLRALVDESAATPAFRPPHVKLGPLPGSKELDALLRRGDPAGAAAPAPVVPAKNPGTPGPVGLSTTWPWSAVGRVRVGRTLPGGGVDWTGSGSGCMVGRSVMVTASHVAPWEFVSAGDWVMEFSPGYYNRAPFGSGFVAGWYGTIDEGEVGDIFGRDYVVCGLYTRSSAGGR
jgi:hypothetical protein